MDFAGRNSLGGYGTGIRRTNQGDDGGGSMKSLTILLALSAAAFAQDVSDRFYDAIRNNDFASLHGLIKTSDVNAKDKHGSTPLMYSAAFGSLESMQALLDAKADVNAKNAFDATALMWGAGDLKKVRLLLDKGADVNARSKPGRSAMLIACTQSGTSEIVKLFLQKGADFSTPDSRGITPLLAATLANDTETITLLLSRGADVKAASVFGDSLMNSAALGNTAVIKMLLAKGADVHAVSVPQVNVVKNGPIGLGSFTALLLASPYGGMESAKLLIEAGSNVNAKDVRGMTPLMLAIATDRPDPKVIRLLLDKGADPKIKDNNGESAIDWATKFGYGPVMKELGIERAQSTAPSMLLSARDRELPTPKDAAEKGISILQQVSSGFMKEGGCVACHAQNITASASAVAHNHGIRVDEAAAAEHLKTAKLQWVAAEQPLLQRLAVPGGSDTVLYSLLQMAAQAAPPDRAIDAMIYFVATDQTSGGNWHAAAIARPPMQDGDFSRTAFAIRMLKEYGPPGRKAEFDQRIERAAAWLKNADARTTEDRTMQLLGLKWANADLGALRPMVKQLASQQRSDGGWAQTPELASDAYATGEALYTLRQLGTAVSEPSYKRGVEFLLRTQRADGSWYVKSRAPKFQPYFQSGFPHDHDQWISAAGTAWAVMGLSYAAGEKPMTANIR
jgi:ankyrin repeat protein